MLRTSSDAPCAAGLDKRGHRAPSVLLAGAGDQEMIAPRSVHVEVASQQPLLAESAPLEPVSYTHLTLPTKA